MQGAPDQGDPTEPEMNKNSEPEQEAEQSQEEEKAKEEEQKKEDTKKETGRGIPIYHRVTSLSGKFAGFLLKLFGSTSCSFSNSFSSKYRVDPDSLPGLNYQLAFTELDFGEVLSSSQGNIFTISSNNRFDILKSLSSAINTKYTYKKSENSGNKSKEVQLKFPSVSLSYSGLDAVIPGEITNRTNLTTGFSRTVTNKGNSFWTTPENVSTNYQMAPLLSISTTLFKKFDTSISCNLSNSYSENRAVSLTKNKKHQFTLTGGLQYSFRAPKGLKILFFKRLRLRNELTTNLNITYNISQKQIKSKDEPWGEETNSSTLKIEPRFTYEFSRDIDGGFNARYEVENDKKKNQKRTTTQISLWVKFKF